MHSDQQEANSLFYKRLKEATGCGTIPELAHFFDVAPSVFSDWSSNMRMPSHQESFLRLRGINPEWVRSGKGKKYLGRPQVDGEAVSLELSCPLKKDLQRMLKACNHCSAWAAFIQSKK